MHSLPFLNGLPRWIRTTLSRIDMRSIATAGCLLLLAQSIAPAQNVSGGEPRWANSLGTQMVRIEPGSFTMGSTNGDWDEQPVHKVTISQPFWMSVRKVTLAEYKQFRPKHDLAAPSGAATGVSWNEATAFCRWLSEKEGKPYRLPTEAEWEYACRLNSTPVMTSNLPAISPGAPAEGQSRLREMNDAVPEWCLDRFGEYQAGDQIDPVGPDTGIARVVRGDKLDDSHHLLRGKSESDYRRPANRAGMAPAFGLIEDSGIDASAPGRHSIGFRIVQAPMPTIRPWTATPPLVQCGIKQDTKRSAREHAPDPAKPYFRKRYLLPTPLENCNRRTIDAAGLHPAFCGHNHSPALEVMPNGDLLLVIFTSWTEYEPEMSLMATRLRFGADEWEMPSYFLDFPDACDNCPLLWTEGEEVRLIWANTCGIGAYPFQWMVSSDSGATWGEVKFPQFTTTLGPHSRQPINTALRDRDGTIYVSSDGAGASSLLWISKDGMNTWQDLGGRTGGRHTTFTLLDDGRTLLGMGGKNSDIHGFMPKSISDDGGRTWQISATGFPAYGANQRPCVLRLKSGRLFFCGDFQRIDGASPATVTNRGAFASLSEDDGRTWRVKKLPGTLPHENPRSHGGADTLGYSVARQAPNGMIHLITTMNRPCLHLEFNEAWILSGDAPGHDPARLMANTATAIRNVRRYEEKHDNGKARVVWHAGIGNDGRYLLHGKETWYYLNGRKQYDATFEFGRKVGTETFRRVNGSKAWRWQHAADGTSQWTQWWAGGQKQAESLWRNSYADGLASRWDTKGEQISSVIFRHGKIEQ
jgi:formylglycine-generating enzyme required for sulfatase activity